MLSSVLQDVGARVLLIDDDADSREIYRHVLEWVQFEVETASNGRAGIRAAVTRPPDLIFLDLDMPGLSGVDVLRQLRANPTTAHVPIAALTGAPELLDQIVDVRFDAVIAKPALDDQLTSVARRLTAAAGI